MTESRPFNREKFLFAMLGGIFIWQAALFSVGVFACFKQGGLKACPELGQRYENTVNVMVATTLALLTGGAALGAIAKPADPDATPDKPVAGKSPARYPGSSVPPAPPAEQPNLGHSQGKR